ncbi:MAG: hypothetical protein E4H42_01630 [Chromatiales bacterium]|nr:MAG: hypothetical protein E4H42_01630 [Chromatiales bacterium]
MKTTRSLFMPAATLLLAATVWAQPAIDEPLTVATINGTDISQTEFEQAVYSVGRGSMYHGKPTEEAQYLEFRRNVMDQLVERRLLLDEAIRRGLQPDSSKIAESLAVYERRYSTTERWKREGDQMLASLRDRFEDDDLLAKLEQEVREVDDPPISVLREFYAQNSQSFTEPKQDRVSVILLGQQPSAGAAAWQAARDEANDILRRLGSGGDFSEMARLHSSDVSAATGGDMGYLHDGMLSTAAQTAIDSLAVGDISEPITVLEGIAIFQLVDRKPPELRPFEQVGERAAGLWRRDVANDQWNALLDELRAAAVVQLNEEYLASVPVAR